MSVIALLMCSLCSVFVDVNFLGAESERDFFYLLKIVCEAVIHCM